jgi:Domain of unknown function (DUF1918)
VLTQIFPPPMADGLDAGDLGPSRHGGPPGTLACNRRMGTSAGRPGRTEEVRAVMKAHVGDRLVPDGDPHRVGVIIGLQHCDGSPPYVVKWLSGGHIALVFPGPYTKIIREADHTLPAPDCGVEGKGARRDRRAERCPRAGCPHATS